VKATIVIDTDKLGNMHCAQQAEVSPSCLASHHSPICYLEIKGSKMNTGGSCHKFEPWRAHIWKKNPAKTKTNKKPIKQANTQTTEPFPALTSVTAGVLGCYLGCWIFFSF